jgi:AcrR family transcriptional regulator
MGDAVNPRRPYDGSGRREQAQRNRSAVLECAHRLFLDRGFAATTMPDVAEAAGVSVQNVYKVFGNKVGLAKAVFDVAIAGDDDPIPMIERPTLRKVRDAIDPREKLVLYGRHLAEVAPRHVPLQLVILDAAAADRDAARLWQELQDERLRGMAMFARDLAAQRHLRSGVSATEAAEVLWTYNSAELYRLLVIERGWKPTRYGRWVAAALTAALLPPSP